MYAKSLFKKTFSVENPVVHTKDLVVAAQNSQHLFFKMLFLCVLFFVFSLSATSTPQNFTYQGRFMNAAGTAPLTGNLSLVVEIYEDAGTPDCLMFSERHSLTTADGLFSVVIGSGTRNSSYLSFPNDPSWSLKYIFDNSHAFSAANCPAQTLAATAQRKLRMHVYDGSTWTQLPDQLITAVPQAVVAETLQGREAIEFAQTWTTAARPLTPVLGVIGFNSTENRMESWNGSAWVQKTPKFNVNTRDNTAGNNHVMRWDNTANEWVATALGTLLGSAQGDLSGTWPTLTVSSLQGHTLDLSPTLTNTAGDIGKVLKWNGVKWVAGTDTSGASISGTGTDNRVVKFTNSGTQIANSSIADTTTSVNFTKKIDMGANLITGLSTSTGTSTDAVSVAYLEGYVVPGSGLIPFLKWNTSNNAWEPTALSLADIIDIADLDNEYVRRDGTLALTGDWSGGGHNIINVGVITQAANKYLGLSRLTNAQESALETSLDAMVDPTLYKGSIWYNINTDEIKYYDGTDVVAIGSGGGGGGGIANGTTASATLRWNGTAWVETTGIKIDGSGNVVLAADPDANMEAATKQYVDAAVASSASGTGTASKLPKWANTSGDLNDSQITDNGTSGVSFANSKIQLNGSLFLHTTGTTSQFMGLSSGNTSTAGSSNVAVGPNTLTEVGFGSSNVAVGHSALEYNTTGSANIAVGRDALKGDATLKQTGGSNAAIGHYALTYNTTGGNNSAFGTMSLYANTTGQYNVAIGGYTLQGNVTDKQTGSNNTAAGYMASNSNTTGSANVNLGYQAGVYTTTGSDNVIVGAGAAAKLNTGSSGNVILGRSAGPAGAAADHDNKLFISNSETSTPLIGGDFAGSTLRFEGNVGVKGAANATYELDVNGSIEAAAYYYASDARLKENISTLEGPLEKILKLRAVEFDWIKTGQHEIGFIAQEVEKTYPDLVSTDKQGWKAVKYGNIVAPLVGATQELYGLCMMSQFQMAALNNRLSKVEREIATVSRRDLQQNLDIQKLKRENEILRQEILEIKKALQK